MSIKTLIASSRSCVMLTLFSCGLRTWSSPRMVPGVVADGSETTGLCPSWSLSSVNILDWCEDDVQLQLALLSLFDCDCCWSLLVLTHCWSLRITQCEKTFIYTTTTTTIGQSSLAASCSSWSLTTNKRAESESRVRLYVWWQQVVAVAGWCMMHRRVGGAPSRTSF